MMDGQKIGYLNGVYTKGTREFYLWNYQVSPEYRREGISAFLIGGALKSIEVNTESEALSVKAVLGGTNQHVYSMDPERTPAVQDADAVWFCQASA